jgi:hypothetical protein
MGPICTVSEEMRRSVLLHLWILLHTAVAFYARMLSWRPNITEDSSEAYAWFLPNFWKSHYFRPCASSETLLILLYRIFQSRKIQIHIKCDRIAFPFNFTLIIITINFIIIIINSSSGSSSSSSRGRTSASLAWPTRLPDHFSVVIWNPWYMLSSQSRAELLNRIMDSCAHIRSNHDFIKRVTASITRRPPPCTDTQGGHFEAHKLRNLKCNS